MANSIKRKYSADAANIFVRHLLCEISEALKGFSEEDKKRTLKHFDYRCAYTGVKLPVKSLTLDHLVPQNRAYCGLHLYGNIVPASDMANKSKGSKDFETFLNSDSEVLKGIDEQTRKERILSLREFQRNSGYIDKVNSINNLKDFVQEKYQHIQDLAIESFEEVKLQFLTKEFDASFNAVLESLKLTNEIEKIKRRVPKWLNDLQQDNSQVLVKYLELLNGRESTGLNEFKQTCLNTEELKSSFKMMFNIGKSYNGKIFDIIDDELYLWEPTRDFIKNEYKQFKLLQQNKIY